MTAVPRTAPSASTCTRPLPLGSAIPLATGPQKRQKVKCLLSFAVCETPDRILLAQENKSIFFFLLENQLSSLCKGSVVQEGLLGAQEKPGINGRLALDKPTGTPMLTQIIVQTGVVERY